MMKHPTQLTSAEIACIWTNYMQDSMSKCVLTYFLQTIEDEDIRSLIQLAYNISYAHIEELTTLFQKEQIPLPTGFTDEDVNVNAPRLYTDAFMLQYLAHMARVGMLGYSGFTSMGARKDIKTYFLKGLQEVSDLFDKITDVLLEKGLYIRAPYIAYPTKTDFIDTHKYFSGFSLFSKQRPLNAVEISHLYMNSISNHIGSKLFLSFAQISPHEQVQNWMLRGRDISRKHMRLFTKLLLDSDIESPISPDVAITDSTTSPFSGKLMMFHMGMLSATGTGNYATAASASQRTDLVINYERLSLEVAQYAKDGADIMIKNKWMEQPPTTLDKEQLVKKKE
ncbi:DUF3231 family protein [Priestia endophytica]|jgi:hypothetical protein|uniref:DUF3231 family protein n=1 Tax=Priestia endophytica DSM 13796 TaxID=1121089 RepID=A0A1I6BIB8_9BACI|nr:DUF3231 family protein [Priestia endophytica]KAB2492682.1 DUF3231 family protein [Priestia endophytica]KYG25717.1 hypothetical protein AZF06_18030 [Priestia endophytica]MBG9811330.1 hypothetical protein [Priestia endophytica]SFQ80679.1 Protein of unknown function [Priestia endophytica DSM 13796]